MIIPREDQKMKEAYLAGFLDGDGSLLAQLVKRNDLRFKFQIRISINFYQKSSRHWFLIQLQKELGGSLIKRNDGMSVLSIVQTNQVENLLIRILPHLRIKHNLAKLLLEIINEKKSVNNECEFIKVCKKVDKVAELTDSKKRIYTSEYVENLITRRDLT